MSELGSKPSEKEACEKCGKTDGTVRAVGRDDLRRICADCYVEEGSLRVEKPVRLTPEWTLIARDEYAGWVVTGPSPEPGERVRVAPVSDKAVNEAIEAAFDALMDGIDHYRTTFDLDDPARLYLRDLVDQANEIRVRAVLGASGRPEKETGVG